MDAGGHRDREAVRSAQGIRRGRAPPGFYPHRMDSEAASADDPTDHTCVRMWPTFRIRRERGVDPGPARSTAAAPGVTGRLEIVLKGLAATMSLDPGFIDGGSSPVLPAGIAGPHGPRRGPGWGSMPRPSRSTGMERSMASALPPGARVPTLGSRPMPCAGVRPNRLSWTTLQPTSRTPV